MQRVLWRSMSWKAPVRVAITSGAGPVAYSLLFRIASGAFLGHDQQVLLQIHDTAERQAEARGVAMELDDCAFPLVKGVFVTDSLTEAMRDADFAFLNEVRAKSLPKEKSDLLRLHAETFSRLGEALNAVARRSVRVLLLGNAASTNCLLVMHTAKTLRKENFTAMVRLSHNRAVSLLAAKTKTHVTDIKKVIIWGNHSSTMFPDLTYATVAGTAAGLLVQKQWITDEFIPTIQSRRKIASASAVATAAVDHMRDWVLGSGDWTSMGLATDQCPHLYGVPKGIVFSYPVQCQGGKYTQVKNLAIDKDAQDRLQLSAAELLKERKDVEEFLK